MPDDHPSFLQRLRDLAARLFENNIPGPYHAYIHPADLHRLRRETGFTYQRHDPPTNVFGGINLHPTAGAPEGTPLLVERDRWQYRWERAELERQRLQDQTDYYRRTIAQMYGQPNTYLVANTTAAGTNETYARIARQLEGHRAEAMWVDDLKPRRPEPPTMRELW